MSDIRNKNDLLKVIFFYYNDWLIREHNRHIKKEEKEKLSKMKFSDLVILCKTESIPISKKELKISHIWKGVWE